MTRILVCMFLFGVVSCAIKSDIKNSVFYNGVLISTESWDIVAVLNFYDNTYDILTTDNSHGQMDKKITEKGDFKVREDTLIMTPNVRLICTELVKEWQRKTHVVYMDTVITDSIFVYGLRGCSNFSEFKYVSRDTISETYMDKLGFEVKKYFVFKEGDNVILKGDPHTRVFRKWILH